MSTIFLPLAAIKTDCGTQPRGAINPFVVARYAEKMKEGNIFPPITVYYDGTSHILAGGFHRYYAAEAIRRHEIQADVRQGTIRDAILFSVGENAEHGNPRTVEDERRAVRRLLEDAEWRDWSDRDIARQCKVSRQMVADMRQEIYSHTGPESQSRIYVNPKTGEPTFMSTGGIVAANQARAAGVREKESPQQDIALAERLRSVVMVMNAVPSAELAAIKLRSFPLDTADRIARWWSDFAEELREIKESAA